jgi:hypothetical protein
MEHAGVGAGGPHSQERVSENQYIRPTIVGSALLLLLTAPYVAQRGLPTTDKLRPNIMRSHSYVAGAGSGFYFTSSSKATATFPDLPLAMSA